MPKSSKKARASAKTPAPAKAAEPAVDSKEALLREVCYASVKRTRDLFGGACTLTEGKTGKLTFRQQLKVSTEYGAVKDLVVKADAPVAGAAAGPADADAGNIARGGGGAATSSALSLLPNSGTGSQLSVHRYKVPTPVLQPEWHAPWKLMRVISGHLGWVRAVAVDPANQWFATGAGDRTIKIWDMASGALKLTLTGHISTIRGLAVSATSPYLFSAAEDKTVKCWDLEQNKVTRPPLCSSRAAEVQCRSFRPTALLL